MYVCVYVTTSHQFCSSYFGCQSGDGSTIKCHAWCTSHCRAMHPGTCLTTSTLSPTMVVDQHMTGHARCLGHTPASVTEVSASLDHVCGTLCRRLCDKTLATDSLSDSFGVRWPRRIVNGDSCALEIFLLTYLYEEK